MQKDGQGSLTRRKVLATLGLAACTVSGVNAFPNDKKTASSEAAHKFLPTAQDMKKDTSLKEGDLVRTSGYHNPGDGGHAEYIVLKEGVVTHSVIALRKGLVASLMNVTSINYKMFGTVSDGKNDDGVQIKAAHEYANQFNIPVHNTHGEFWIRETAGISILTNVEWGNSIFHINEKYNSSASRFEIKSNRPANDINFSVDDKNELIKHLKPGTSIIPLLAPYKNCLIIVEDRNDKIGIRSGASYQGKQSKPRTDFFYVEEHGRITGDIAWEFTNYTHLVAIPVSDSFLTVSGGTFYLSGDNSGAEYLKNGFVVNRSRTIIRNQCVGLEPGKEDMGTSARSGFYTFSKVYNVLLENVRLIPYVSEREGEARKMSGTYGLGGGHVLNGTFRNVTAEGGLHHWGVFGTNLIKNFRIEQCSLNRVDVHFHCWNLYIKDSTIGYKGIAVTGGGELIVENSSCAASSFINFRRDYGSKWDGDIRITNCRFFPSQKEEGVRAILSYFPMNFDYKYPLGLGRSIIVEDFVVDFTGNNSNSVCWLIRSPDFSKAKHGDRVFFPHYIEFRNVSVEGRESGLRLMKVISPQVLNVRRKGSYDGIQLKTNSRIVFNNIQLEDLGSKEITKEEEVHILFDKLKESKYQDQFSLYPEVKFIDCKNLAADFGGNIADVSFSNCSIIKLSGSNEGLMPGKLSLFNTVIQPQGKSVADISILLASELGTSLTNCTIHSPSIGSVLKPELFNALKFIQINKVVQFNQVNTLLGRDVLNYLKEKGISLKPEFVAMLKNHHELESENLA